MYHRVFLCVFIFTAFISGCTEGDSAPSSPSTLGGDTGQFVGPISLVTAWSDNVPLGGNAYRAKFRAMQGGHYTTPLDLPDSATVHSLTVGIRRNGVANKVNVGLIGLSNDSEEVTVLAAGEENKNSSIVLTGPVEIDRYSMNYRLDLNVENDGETGQWIDITSPPILLYSIKPNLASP